MLVLTRKLGEKILIGDDITLTVVDLRPDRVRIGVDAPREVQVWRQEFAPRGKEGGDDRPAV